MSSPEWKDRRIRYLFDNGGNIFEKGWKDWNGNKYYVNEHGTIKRKMFVETWFTVDDSGIMQKDRWVARKPTPEGGYEYTYCQQNDETARGEQ